MRIVGRWDPINLKIIGSIAICIFYYFDYWMLRRYCFEKFCISGELEIPVCIFVAGRRNIKDLLVQAGDKDKHDIWGAA